MKKLIIAIMAATITITALGEEVIDCGSRVPHHHYLNSFKNDIEAMKYVEKEMNKLDRECKKIKTQWVDGGEIHIYANKNNNRLIRYIHVEGNRVVESDYLMIEDCKFMN